MASFEEIKANIRKAMLDVRMKENKVSNEEVRENLEALKHELTMIRGLEMQAMKIGIDLSKVEIDDLLEFSSVLFGFCERYNDFKTKGEGRQ